MLDLIFKKFFTGMKLMKQDFRFMLRAGKQDPRAAGFSFVASVITRRIQYTIKQHLADVLRTSAESNPETYTRLRREGKMSEAVNLIFADKIEEAAEKKEEQVVAAMLQNNEPAEKMDLARFLWDCPPQMI